MKKEILVPRNLVPKNLPLASVDSGFQLLLPGLPENQTKPNFTTHNLIVLNLERIEIVV